MPEGLLRLFEPRPRGQILTDVLDLFIVAYLVYRALLVLRGTRAMQMGTGLGLIFLIYIAAKWLSLLTLLNLLSTLLSSIILIVVVVFQNDIRRGLMRVGSRAFLEGLGRGQETRVIDEVVAAATELARHRMGALIAFEQDANLDEFVVSQGIPIDSSVTRELLVSLFVPESVNKLHDGAVILRNLRVSKAGVFFPMPESRIVDTSLGSRHRAALGITEETDAVVVVVSEERGTISFCFSGNIVSNLDGASLRQALLGLFGRKPRKKSSKRIATPARASTASGLPRLTPVAQAPLASSGAEPEASSPAEPGAARVSTPSTRPPALIPPPTVPVIPSPFSTPRVPTPPPDTAVGTETAVASAPATAVASAPATAVASAPATAVASAPATAVASAPATAVASAPAMAVTSTPATAVASAPAMATTSAPATAVASAPAMAMTSTPATAQEEPSMDFQEPSRAPAPGAPEQDAARAAAEGLEDLTVESQSRTGRESSVNELPPASLPGPRSDAS